MNGNPSIFERLELAAAQGFTTKELRIWKPTIKKLIAEGFTVTILKSTNRIGEKYCNIDWSSPTTEDGFAAKLLRTYQN